MKATGFGKNIVKDMKMDNAIEVNGLTKYLGGFPVVDRISFEVKKGEIFGFLGPNGAAKTTIIRLHTGQTRPTLGSLTVAVRDVISEPSKAKEFIGRSRIILWVRT